MTPTPASELLRDTRGRELLAAQIDADAEHVSAALTRARMLSPLCCLGFVYVADDETAAVSYINGWTREARDEAFAVAGEAALWKLWSQTDWDLDLDDLIAPPAPSPLTRELTQLLLDVGCEEPAGAVLMDLAHRLNRSPLSVEITADFACWASEHEMSDEPWRWMTAAARREVVERYARRGWLRLPGD